MPTGRPGWRSSSTATSRSLRRTSSVATSESRCPPIVRSWYAPVRSRSRATSAGTNDERVELSVRVRQRGAGIAALVDDQMQEGGAVGVGAHPLAPGGDRAGEPLLAQVRERRDVLRCVDDHLVRADRRLRREEVGLADPRRLAQRVDRARQPRLGGACVVAGPGLLSGDQHRVEVGDRAGGPARGVGLAAVRAGRPDLGRRPVLAALAERAGLGGFLACLGRRGRERVRALGPAGREDRPAAR